MEQGKCCKCESYTDEISAETIITVAKITTSALSKWFAEYSIKFTYICCKKKIAAKETRSFPVSLLDILIVCSHKPFKGNLIHSQSLYNDGVIPMYRKIDEYHDLAALSE